MKKLSTVLMVVMIVAGCAMAAVAPVDNVIVDSVIPDTSSTYTYDGEFDPMVFFSWDIILKEVCPRGHTHYFLQNPDKESDVTIVETMNIDKGGGTMMLVAYRYVKNGERYIFSLDLEKGHYGRVLPKPLDKSGGI